MYYESFVYVSETRFPELIVNSSKCVVKLASVASFSPGVGAKWKMGEG